MKRLEADHTTAKEKVSFDKIRSVASLFFGQRALHFDALLNSVPTSTGMTALASHLDKPEIHNTIFDLDGNLVSPYAQIPKKVVDLLLGYKKDGRNIGIYTNSPHTDRLDVLRDNEIAIAENGIGKPTLAGFMRFCEQQDMDPAHTAMIGNSAITDMPLVKGGQDPFFPLNVLTESIPPHRQNVESNVKHWRAKLFHIIAAGSAKFVAWRNPNILREIPPLGS